MNDGVENSTIVRLSRVEARVEPYDWAFARENAALIAAPGIAPLFGPGSRAEVAIEGAIATPSGPLSVSGRIDRLVAGEGRILIADFKTDRSPPADLKAVPESHQLQLALYRAVLERLYPGRKVDAVLVYTEAPRLIAVPSERLDGHISRITRA